MPQFSLSLKKLALAAALSVLPLSFFVWMFVDLVERRQRFPDLQLGMTQEPWLLGSLIIALVVYWAWTSWRVLGTTISIDGIRQPTLFGVSEVRWRDATYVRITQGHVLRLVGPNGRVGVHCYLYTDPVGVLEYSLRMARQPKHTEAAA